MSRRSRTLLKAATVLSLFLFVATIAAWAGGTLGVGDNFTCRINQHAYRLGYDRGRLFLKNQPHAALALPPPERTYGALGLQYTVAGRDITREWTLTIHCFYPAALSLAAFLLTRKILRRTRPIGLCPACNYDLRATPDRCPECGAIPPRPNNQAALP